MPKITLIGAGSVVFAKTLVCDLLQFPEFADCTLCVMDIDPARLKVAEVMVRKVIAKLGVPARVEATLDRREAVRGAKYVICTIQVGGYKPGTVIDFEIPRKYGLLQTIGDTLGVGGVFRGLRTIPKLVEIARDIADVGAPGCLFLNYTNPMAMLCMAIDHAVGVPTVGLCHSVQGTSQLLARECGLPYEDVTFKVAGINHMAFFLEFKYRGQDAYPLLFRKLREGTYQAEKVRFEMMRRLGHFVTESSEHQSEYNPHFIHFGKEMIAKFDIPIDEYLRRCEAILSSWQEQERQLIGRDGEIHVPPQGHEYGSYIIHSRETNTPRVVYGNVPNTGLITNLPHRCCVELPVLVDGQGLQPTFIGDLPPQLAAICRSNINVQELTVKAALTGRREHIYHAVMADPHTAATLPLDRIWAMCDELIEAHQKVGLLGEYSPTLPGTGRALAGTGDRCILQLKPVGVQDVRGGQRHDFELEADSTYGAAVRAKVELRVKGSEPLTAPGTVAVKVPAGGRARTRFSVTVPADAGCFTIEPVADSARFLAIPFVSKPRRRIRLEGSPADVSVSVHGQALLEGRLSVEGGQLRLEGRVADTDVKLNPDAPWQGSSIELFTAALDGTEIRQMFFLPDARKPRVVSHSHCGESTAEGTKASCKVDRNGYKFSVTVPLPAHAADSKALLLDLIVSANAVGEAHGPGRAGWGGAMDSWHNTAHYAQLAW